MVDHLLNYSDRFISVLAGWWFLVLLARVVMFGEALRIVVDGTWSEKIRMPRHYVLPFLMRSLVNRVRWKLRLFLAFGPHIHPIAKIRNRSTN